MRHIILLLILMALTSCVTTKEEPDNENIASIEAALNSSLPITHEIDGKKIIYPVNDSSRIKIGYYNGKNNIHGNFGPYKYSIGAAISSDNGESWVRINNGNTVLNPGFASWANHTVKDPFVLKIGSEFIMYFAAYSGSKYSIGRTVSTDGINWSIPKQVLTATQSWEENNVKFPYVLFDEKNTLRPYQMWYSTLHDCGYAYSIDGLNWTKTRNSSLITRTAESYYKNYAYISAVKKIGDTYHAFFSGRSEKTWRSGYVTFVDPEAEWIPSTPLLNPKKNAVTKLTTAGFKGDYIILVENASNFEVGEYVILDDNSIKTAHQMPCIESISGDTLNLDRALSFNFSKGYDVKSIYSNSNFVSDFWYNDIQNEWIYSFVAFQQFSNVVLEFSVFGVSQNLGDAIQYDYSRGQLLKKQQDNKAWDWTSRENFKLVYDYN